MKRLLLVLFILAFVPVVSAQETTPSQFVSHNGQELFLSGINLAWVNFAHDLENFDEVRFVAALDEIAAAKGNSLRWWLHTNGSASPLYGEDGKVSGLAENDIENLKRGIDLAYERGILVMPTLWSHDMMNTPQGVPTEFNKLMIEDPAYTQAYIDNALTPMVTALKGHPGIIAWEIFNEPEGTTTPYGWTDMRTEMPFIQQFVNLLAGAIHRADPDAKVTNGSWNMQVLTDVGGFTNYYKDDLLIAAGGDPLGTLDFYQVHYYPEWFDEATSPFHNPYSYWELDKPLVVGEFPATAIADLGMGFRPQTELSDSAATYEFLYQNGYAGALTWMFYDSPHGDMADTAPGMLRLHEIAPEHIAIDVGDVNHIPVLQQRIDNVIVDNTTTALDAYVTLSDVFTDKEDAGALTYTIAANSNADIVDVVIDEAGVLSLTFTDGLIGTSTVKITATDSGGNTSSTEFIVQVIDPNSGNVALGKTAVSSTIESQGYLPQYAVDGLDNTRWSSEYTDGQTLDVDLGAVYSVNQVILEWETAFGLNYEIQAWDGANWQTVYAEPASDGQIDDIVLPESVDTRFIRFNGIQRGTEWGFSLWEFEVYGVPGENADVALETLPDTLADVPQLIPPTVSDVTLIHSFEADTEGWQLADYWAGGTGLSVSTEGANEGTQALALSLLTTGGSWQEGGVFIQPEGGVDWSAYSGLAMDVYLPEAGTDFIAQIFFKTGDDWTWANTPDTALVPGQWTTITADLGAMGDSSAVYEFGIKIGSSVATFDGLVLIDNVRLISLQAASPGEKPQIIAGAETLVNGFETDVEGWVLADYWTGGTGVAVSADGASEGAQSLALSLLTTGGSWQEGGVFIQPEGGVDWSAYNQLSVDIYLPEGATDFIAQIFFKTGDDWTWANTPDTALVPGQWTTVTADLSAMGDSSAVYEFGIKVGSSVTAFDGLVLIDNVRLISTATAAGGGTASTPA